MRIVLAVTLAAFAVVSSAPAAEPIGFVKGYSWGWTGWRGSYASPAAADSMRKLAETGADTACIAFAANLPAYDDPRFTWGDDNPRMVSDDEVRRAIDLARENGLRVILKPVVNCADGTWRAWIRFHRPLTDAERAAGQTGVDDPWGEEPGFREGQARDLEAWAEFGRRYKAFLEHYARIAQEKRVDAFCIGCEMNSTEEFVAEWRDAIARVRAAYDGPITYNANHGREALVPFWDEVDFLSVSGYYPTPLAEGQTAEQAAQATTPKAQIVAALEHVRDELRAVHAEHGKPILFIETGVTSVRGAAHAPWSHANAHLEVPIDEAEQARYYEAMLETFWDEPWLLGYAWWDWPARLYPKERASQHRGFCAYGKQAETVLRDWYARQRE